MFGHRCCKQGRLFVKGEVAALGDGDQFRAGGILGDQPGVPGRYNLILFTGNDQGGHAQVGQGWP
jgi:hypothetical protein